MFKNKTVGCCLLFILVALIIPLGGCNMNELILTNDERRVLLCSGATDEQLDQGLLSNSQEKMLDALRQAKAYLEERYPTEQFEFLSVNLSSPLKSPFTFIVKSASMVDESFAVRVCYEKDAENQYTITESYYADIKKRELFLFIENLFSDFGLTAKAVLSLDGLFGNEYDPAKSVADTIDAGLNFGISGWIYVSGPIDLDQYIPAISSKLIESRICGGFRLMLVEGISLEEQANLGVKDKRYITEETYVSLLAEAGGKN